MLNSMHSRARLTSPLEGQDRRTFSRLCTNCRVGHFRATYPKIKTSYQPFPDRKGRRHEHLHSE